MCQSNTLGIMTMMMITRTHLVLAALLLSGTSFRDSLDEARISHLVPRSRPLAVHTRTYSTVGA